MQRLRTFYTRRKPIKVLIAGCFIVLGLNACDLLNDIEAEFTEAGVNVAGHDGETYDLHANEQDSSRFVKVGTLAADGTLEFFAAESIAAEGSYNTAESLLCDGEEAVDIDVTPATAEGTDILLFALMLALPAGTTVDEAIAQAEAEDGGSVNVVTSVPTDRFFGTPDLPVWATPGIVFTPEATSFEVNCPAAYAKLDLQAGFNEVLSTLTFYGGGVSRFMTTDVGSQAFDWNYGSTSNAWLLPN